MSTTDTPTFNPDCAVCAGTGWDDAFGTTCTECWGFVPRRCGWSGNGPSLPQRAERNAGQVARSTVAEDDSWKRQPRWKKEGASFLVVIPVGYRLDGRKPRTGDTVPVHSRNGVKPVQLGVESHVDQWGSVLFWPVRDNEDRRAAPQAPKRELVPEGFYSHEGDIYRVQASRTSNRRYAKVLTEHGWSYAEGAIARLSPDEKLTEAEAAAYGKRTGTCIFCSRELTDPESIERGIGPICLAKWC